MGIRPSVSFGKTFTAEIAKDSPRTRRESEGSLERVWVHPSRFCGDFLRELGPECGTAAARGFVVETPV